MSFVLAQEYVGSFVPGAEVMVAFWEYPMKRTQRGANYSRISWNDSFNKHIRTDRPLPLMKRPPRVIRLWSSKLLLATSCGTWSHPIPKKLGDRWAKKGMLGCWTSFLLLVDVIGAYRSRRGDKMFMGESKNWRSFCSIQMLQSTGKGLYLTMPILIALRLRNYRDTAIHF